MQSEGVKSHSAKRLGQGVHKFPSNPTEPSTDEPGQPLSDGRGQQPRQENKESLLRINSLAEFYPGVLVDELELRLYDGDHDSRIMMMWLIGTSQFGECALLFVCY